MPNSHDNIPSILSKNLRVLSGLCGEYATAIRARSTRQVRRKLILSWTLMARRRIFARQMDTAPRTRPPGFAASMSLGSSSG